MPLSFGGNVYWARTVMEVLAFFSLGLFLIKNAFIQPSRFRFPLLCPVFLLVVLVVLQLVPLPVSVLKVLSPGAYDIYSEYLPHVPGVAGLRTLSLCPAASAHRAVELAAYLSIFFLVVNMAKTRKDINRLVLVIILVGCFEAFYGLIEYFSGSQHILFYKKKWYLESATGTFINRNHFAGYLEMVVPLVLGLALSAVPHLRNWRASLKWMAGERVNLVALGFFAVIVMSLAIIFSRSRAGILSFAASMVFLGCLFAGEWGSRSKLWIIVSILVIVLLAGVWMGLDVVTERFAGLADTAHLGDSAGGRWIIWKASLGLVKEYPIFGCGLGAFVSVFPVVQPAIISNAIYDHAHNDYLEFLVEFGIVGLVCLIWILVLIVRKAVALLRAESTPYARGLTAGIAASMLAILLHSFTDFGLHMPANALVFAVLIGILFSMEPGGTNGSSQL
ncbi:MAG: O-antigen ligase family protein [Candidatus Tritonobacter lacicola]|nr:O-antigen ligase family protein [Candidatus Tritonobacter lacicola]